MVFISFDFVLLTCSPFIDIFEKMTSKEESNNVTKPSSLSTSCRKCVSVLQQLVSGLQSETNDKNESSPLTLLKAIAGGDPKQLRIENNSDGVVIHIPVETTESNILRRWTKFVDDTANIDQGVRAIATSVSDSSIATSKTNPTHPLTVELRCRKCSTEGPEGGARAFLLGPTPLSVVICHNRVRSDPEELSEILTHELVHLYDVQNSKLDLQQCENLAYSEIRAAKAAECRNTWSQLQTFCVKQKAICATNNLFPSQGRNCVQKVFPRAFEDNQPFDDDV